MFKLNWIWPIMPFSNQDAVPSQSHPVLANSHNHKGGMAARWDIAWLHKALSALQGALSSSSI